MATATAARARPAHRSVPRRSQAARPRVRWDRLGRVAMLLVLCALVYLYLSAGLSLLSSWRESRRADAQVSALQHEHHLLEAQRIALQSPGTVEAEARQLGMMFPGEHAYILDRLPNN